MIDMLTTVLLRLRAGLHPMKPDRRHLHHTLMDIGLSARQVTAALLSLSLVLGLFGIWISEISETLSMLLYCVLFLANCMYIFKTRRSLDAGPDKVPV
ncbi:hypothetical protein [Sediminihaliea albiluteola]|uniref:hypothetical protein n=1 Tax=Sediminihaliea albiluteola TaxID=2758564 RepID=UPI0015F6F03F|nr:hypothetical protein [Sediminihaliea albiluteola]